MYRKSSLVLFTAVVGLGLVLLVCNLTLHPFRSNPHTPFFAVTTAPVPMAVPTSVPTGGPTVTSSVTPVPRATSVVLPQAHKPQFVTALPAVAAPQVAPRWETEAAPLLSRTIGWEKRSAEEVEEEEEEGKRYDKPGEAAAYSTRKRAPRGSRGVPTERYAVARAQTNRMPVYSSRQQAFIAPNQDKADLEVLAGGAWTSLGPGNIGGRTRALLIHPTNPNVVYAAGVAGGVWRSVDGGANWLALGDAMANLAISTLVFEPSNPNVIYAGTGEGYFNGDAVRGAGIFKTTNGGVTWEQLPGTNTTDFYYVNKLVVSKNNAQRLYAATRTGLWRSVNGGANWTRVLEPLNSNNELVKGGCLDLVLRTDRATDYLFASCGTFEQATIYRNTDAAGTGTWDVVLSEPGMGRTTLALAPSNQNIIYAAAVSNEFGPFEQGLHAVFRSTSSGDEGSWTPQVRNSSPTKLNTVLFSNPLFAFYGDCHFSPPSANRYLNQGWYDNVLAVDPTDANRVWVGGVDLFRSDDGGQNWGLASYWAANGTLNLFAPSYAHADQHVIAFHPDYNGTTNQTMFVGNDGGIFRTNNARATVAAGDGAACNPLRSQVAFTALNNNYGVTQFYHGAVFPDGKTYFGGTQDNGIVLGTESQGTNQWREINGGDGGYVEVNPLNPNVLFAEFANVSLRKSTNGGLSFHNATTGLNTNSLFIAPYAMDPSDPNRLWFGGEALFRTTNAATNWQQASTYLPSADLVSAVAIAPTDANRVLAGDGAGFIYSTNRALSTTYRDLWDVAKPRDGFVSSLAFDPTDKQIAYATYSTFGEPHVWRTTNGGQAWQSIDGSGNTGLPDIPVHCLVVDPGNPQHLYIGTDLGVYASLDGGATWAVENTGFSNTVVESLRLNVQNGVTTLYAFTHGRGAWKVVISNTGCTYTLSATGQAMEAAGGTSSVIVTASSSACPWTAQSNESWITINSVSGTTLGQVTFTVAPNAAFTPRVGTFAVAGRSYTITQAGKEDQTPPTVQIVTPTTQATYAVTVGSMTLGVVSKDNDVLSSITWRTDRGSAGGFTPSSGDNWVSNQINLRTGVNVILVTATDRSGNTATAQLTVSLNAQTGDTTAPTLKITKPTTNATFITAQGLLTVEGTAADNRQVTHVLWSNSRGGSGRADGTTAWTIRNIALQVGINKITVTAYDSNGGTASAVLSVLSNPPQTTRFIAGLDFRFFGFNGDNRVATTALLWSPQGIAFDTGGNLYIADAQNHRIRKVTPGGVITTIAGTGISGLEGDGGPATAATLHSPSAVVFDATGNLYIADTDNHKIRKITPGGIISTYAGTGRGGYDGDGKPAQAAQFNSPISLALDANGNLFIADYGNCRIRKVRASDGVIETVAGNGTVGAAGDGGDATAAQLNLPTGVALDQQGNLFIADTYNSVLRKVGTDGKIHLFAGNGQFGNDGDGGLATAARLGTPFHLAVDKDNNVLFTDEHHSVVRRITTDGKIATVFGNTNGLPREDLAPTSYGFAKPRGLALDSNGNVYVADSFDQKISAAMTLNRVATVEAAGFTGPVVARDAIVTAFGNRLATTEAIAPANTEQLPTNLAGTTVTITDSQGVTHAALLLYVGPTQVNYLIPTQAAEGFATVTIRSALGEIVSGFVEIVAVLPGLFAANADGTGAAAGFAIRVRNNVQTRESLVTLNPATNRFVAKPIEFDPANEALFIELYGTGIRYRSSLANVTCEVGGVAVPVEYASVAPGFYGLDQVNIRLPASLDNRGEVDVVLTVDGRRTKPLRINIK